MTELVIIVATYRDLAEADAAFVELVALHDREPSAAPLDAVTLGRKPSGVARLHRVAGEPASAADGGLSTAIAVALFPSVHSEVPPSLTIDRAAIDATAGELVTALGRSCLMELGSRLDSSPASLLAVTQVPLADRLAAAVASDGATQHSVWIDTAQVDRAVAAAKLAQPGADGPSRR